MRTEDPVPLVMVMGLFFPRGARRSFMRVETEKCITKLFIYCELTWHLLQLWRSPKAVEEVYGAEMNLEVCYKIYQATYLDVRVVGTLFRFYDSCMEGDEAINDG